MAFIFRARIYQIGINCAVDVPQKYTEQMTATKRYIPVRGEINGFKFSKSLVPVKGAPYRLFVNKVMMDGAETAVGKVASFTIAQDQLRKKPDVSMFPPLEKELVRQNLNAAFNELTSSRRNDILRYLHQLKHEETISKNINKVITQLKNGLKDVRIPAKVPSSK